MKVLLHIGYPKTGSTFLKEWFDKHPQIHHRNTGIVGFQQTTEINQHIWEFPDLPFDYYVMSSEALTVWWGPIEMGEKIRLYDIGLHQNRVCEFLYNLFPGAKVMIVLRGYESMIRSLYSSYVRAGGALNFNEFLKQYNDEVLMQFLNYDRTLQVYEERFGVDNILALPYELLQDSPQKFLSEVNGWLNIENFETNTDKRNESLNPIELFWIPKLSGFVFRVLGVFGRKRRLIWFNDYIQNVRRGKFRFLVRLLSIFNRKGADLKIPEDLLRKYMSMAGKVKENKSFQPYIERYVSR